MVRNHFRKKSTTAEVTTDDIDTTALPSGEPGMSQEDRTIQADFFRKALDGVYALSQGDDLVQQMALLAADGVADVDEQVEELKAPTPRVYEARRRFSERLQLVVRQLQEGP